MNIKEERIYLEDEIGKLEKDLTDNIKGRNGTKNDLIYWSYVGRIHQLEETLTTLKRSLHFVQIKEALDEYLSDEDFGQKEVKGLTFEIIDNYNKLLDSDDD